MPLNRLLETPALTCAVCAAPFASRSLSVWSTAAAASICLGCVDVAPPTPALIVPARIRPIREPVPVSSSPVEPDQPAEDAPPAPPAPAAPPVPPVPAVAPVVHETAPVDLAPPAPFAPPIGEPVAVQPPPRSRLLDAIVEAATAASAEPEVVEVPVVELRARSIPRTRHAIDRLIVTSAGVLVVTDRDERGAVEVSAGRRGDRLKIDGKDRTRTLRTSELLATAVAGVLAHLGRNRLTVSNVHCFAHVEFAGGELVVDGVRLMSPSQLDCLLAAEGDMSAASVASLAMQLGDRFPVSSRD